MKPEDLKVGKTYCNRKGQIRKIIAIKPFSIYSSGFTVKYEDEMGKERSCWCTTFAGWAKRVVTEEEEAELKMKRAFDKLSENQRFVLKHLSDEWITPTNFARLYDWRGEGWATSKGSSYYAPLLKKLVEVGFAEAHPEKKGQYRVSELGKKVRETYST